MRKALWLAPIFLLSLVGASWGSDPIGVYALIDKVVIAPSEGNPQTVQIWGAFSFAVKGFGDQYTPPVRGYLYYQLPPDKGQVASAEWADMQKAAGTGQIIAFGSRWKDFGRVRGGAGPAAGEEASEKRILALVAQLDDQQQSARDAASEELKRVGKGWEATLQKAADSATPEAKARIERVLADLHPDPYPVGFGLTRVRADRASEHVRALRTFPSALTPGDGTAAAAGTVRLVAGNIADAASKPEYKFEIESASGQHESSPAIGQGEKQTEWTPKMEIKSGEKYTWRVWVDSGKARGPVAVATFRGK